MRKKYLETCPNVGQLLKNLSFSLPMENELMNDILNENVKPADAARNWLKENPEVLDKRLKQVSEDERRRAEEKLEMVGLAEWKDNYPHELSGGMQQRDSLEGLKQGSLVITSPDISMREGLEIRYRTGQPVLLADDESLVGVLADNDFYHALLGKHFSLETEIST